MPGRCPTPELVKNYRRLNKFNISTTFTPDSPCVSAQTTALYQLPEKAAASPRSGAPTWGGARHPGSQHFSFRAPGLPVQLALLAFLFAHRARNTTARSPDIPDQSNGEETGKQESHQANGSHHTCRITMGGMQQD